MKDECAILVLSCDKNKGLLNIFFDFFRRNWKDCPYKIYLGMEKSNKTYAGIYTLNSYEKKWSERLLDYINQIEMEYVLLILDDFILEKNADTAKIRKYHEYMKENDKIATISMADIFDKNNYSCEYEGLMRRTAKADYLLNLQVGIWRKKVLKSLLRKNENPWQTELYGSIRARSLSNNYFLCLPSDETSPYQYGRGWLMVGGVWNGNEIKRLKLEKYYDDIFDGKNIIYSGFSSVGFMKKVRRRFSILYRKALSRINIYV